MTDSRLILLNLNRAKKGSCHWLSIMKNGKSIVKQVSFTCTMEEEEDQSRINETCTWTLC